MADVGIVVHHSRPAAAELAADAIAWLRQRGHTPFIAASDAEATDLHGAEPRPDDSLGSELDLVLALGGDGTMLRGVALVCHHEVPVLGVNLGHLGYLTEIEAPAMQGALERFFAGEFEIEERMTLRVAVDARSGQVANGDYIGLNEAVLEKTATGHTVRLAVTINGRFFTTYAADGMIIATPTGSTAYNLSARGPVVSPRHRALLLTPVAPHMLFDRTLVLDGADEVALDVIDDRPASLSVDGRSLGPLQPGDGVVCSAGKHVARFVVFGGRDFHQILKTKFGLSDR
jgi:NAD+ kinase